SCLNFESPFLCELVPMLAEQFKNVFPELNAQKDFVGNVIREEEAAFLRTLHNGLDKVEDAFKETIEKIKLNVAKKVDWDNPLEVKRFYKNPSISQSLDLKVFAQTLIGNFGRSDQIVYREIENEKLANKVNGKIVFELYDTYGFPLDLTRLMAAEKGLQIDEKGFEVEMQRQKDRGRTAAATEQSDWVELEPGVKSDFIGYDFTDADAHVVKYRSVKQKDKELYQLVLDKTPFYAESGGQVGDTGYLDFGGEKIDVLDTKKENDLIIHFVKKLPAKIDAAVHAHINTPRRNDTIKNHSATHLLHAALRKVLGTHVAQKGSLVHPDHLRFDFSHFAKMTDEEIAKVEQIVNDKIMENVALDEKRNVPIKEAEKLGAMMLFGEKYGEFVRVITFDPAFSRELCGGCHVHSTGEIGLFKIVSESSISAGVRRIEAVTGRKALEYVNAKINELNAISELFKGAKNVVQSAASLIEQSDAMRKENEHLQDKLLASLTTELKAKVEPLGKVQFLALKNVEVPTADALRKLGIQLVNEVKDNYVFLLSTIANGKTVVHLRVAPSLGINANQLLKELSSTIKGGGPADFVQASAPDTNAVEDLIVKLKEKFK
ncbi:MAG TPA: alanine--tRNA ligase-related protein, partial [Chitinophagales bacterium]|nr:alanine--tRNA ligase-related protein [Chitinophagales bacterium]